VKEDTPKKYPSIYEPTKRAILHPPLTICNQDVIVQIDTSQKNPS